MIRFAGAAALLAGTGLGTASPAWAASPDSDGSDHDVIIIGAGYAGVTAARELRAKGLRTVLLEARDRIGGRIWTDTYLGQSVEFGAQWISPAQLLVAAELKRYGIGTVAGLAPTRLIMPSPDGPRTFPPDVVETRTTALMEALFKGSADYLPRPYDPLYRLDLLRRVDRLSLRDRLNEMNLSADDESWLSGTTSGESGGSSAYGSLAGLAHWWALCGWNESGWEAASATRIQNGMKALLDAMLTDARTDLRLSSPVTSVVDDGRTVRVTTRSGSVFSAPAAIVALPVNVWKTVRFSPELSPARAAATRQGMGAPQVRKLWLHVRGVSDPLAASGKEGDVLGLVVSQAKLDDGQLMVAFNGLPTLDTTDHAQVEAALRYHVPEATLVDLRAQDWGNDEFSLGGWAMPRPGQLTTLFPAIQRQQGRVAFATGDIASGWNGFVDGAIESGIAAAAYVAGTVTRTPA
jgi:monoamine oxidase